MAAVESSRDEPRGRVRVTMPVAVGRHCVAPVLMALGRQHPALELDLSFTDRVVDVVHEGVDLALRVGPLRDSHDLVARRLGLHRMVVCASPGYLQSAGSPSGPEDLPSHRCLVYARNGRFKHWQFHDAEGRLVDMDVSHRWRFDDLEAIAEAAAAGLGLAWLPCWLVREPVASGRLERVLTDLPGLVFDTHLIWPQAPHLPLRVRAAIDALAAELPKMMLT